MFRLYKGWIGSEWEVVGVANNSQWGTSARVREKMLLKSGTDTQQGLIELATKHNIVVKLCTTYYVYVHVHISTYYIME